MYGGDIGGPNINELLVLGFRKHEGFCQLSTVKILYIARPYMRHQVPSRAFEKFFTLLDGLSNSRHCCCEFDLGPSHSYGKAPLNIREEMMLELSQRYTEGRVRFLCDGRDMCDIGAKAVAWMLHCRPSFSSDSTWVIGRMHFISW